MDGPKYARINGWSYPPHPLQLIAWAILIYLSLIVFGVIIPAFASLTTRSLLNAFFALLVLIGIVLNIIVTTLDPADINVRQLKLQHSPRPTFDRSKHPHVIDEHYYCHICETKIDPSSKHCRQCNKCVTNFDHHCKWLNNCIGERNYKQFILYVAATIIICALILLLSLLGISLVATESFIIDFNFTTNQTSPVPLAFGSVVDYNGWMSMVGLAAAICFAVAALNLHLLIFHIKIILRGQTTYGYIMELRNQEEEQRRNDDRGSVQVPPSTEQMPSNSKPKNAWMLRRIWYNLMTNYFKKSRSKTSQRQNQNAAEISAVSLASNHVYTGWESMPAASNGSTPGIKINGTTSVPSESLPSIAEPTSVKNSSIIPSKSQNGISNWTTAIPQPNLQKSSSSTVKLPPINTKIYEPNVETILLDNGLSELTLPTINVFPPSEIDPESARSSMVEIPVSNFMAGSNGHKIIKTNAPATPDLYIASGQFSLVKTNEDPINELSKQIPARRYSNSRQTTQNKSRNGTITPLDSQMNDSGARDLRTSTTKKVYFTKN